MSQKKFSPCGCIALIIGFGFFSLIWELAADVWGLSLNQVLLIFASIVIVAGAVGSWVAEEAWPNLLEWLESRRRGKDL